MIQGLIARVEDVGRVTVVHVTGEVDLTNAPALWDALLGPIGPRRAVVVDLSGLRYIDSVGLHVLLRASQRAQRVQADLIFAAPGDIRHLMTSVGLDRLVQVFPDLETALRTLSATESA